MREPRFVIHSGLGITVVGINKYGIGFVSQEIQNLIDYFSTAAVAKDVLDVVVVRAFLAEDARRMRTKVHANHQRHACFAETNQSPPYPTAHFHISLCTGT